MNKGAVILKWVVAIAITSIASFSVQKAYKATEDAVKATWSKPPVEVSPASDSDILKEEAEK